MRDYIEYLRIPFKHGVSDCYRLVKKFYQDEFGIELTDYEYADHWTPEQARMILDNYRKEGFVRNRTPRFDYGNVILFEEDGYGRHLGIVIGDGFFLHTTRRGTAMHSYQQGYWSSRIIATFTHKRKKP